MWPWWWRVWHKPHKKMVSALPQEKASSAKTVLEYNERLNFKSTVENQNSRPVSRAKAQSYTKLLGILCDHLVFDKVLPLVKYNGTQSNLQIVYLKCWTIITPTNQMTKRRTRNGSLAWGLRRLNKHLSYLFYKHKESIKKGRVALFPTAIGTTG